jgi:galactose mutarotase-like enzyme
MIYTLKNDKIEVKVNSLGAELTSVISHFGHEYVWQGEHWKKHAPVLFPLCGALLDGKYVFNTREYSLGKHGFAKSYEFEAVEVSETSLTLVLEENSETLAVYPFQFALTAHFAIDGNKLKVIFTVKNTGKQILPYMFGWHPAFTLPGSAPIDSFYVDFGEARELSRHTLQNGPFINPFYTTYPIKDGKYYLNEEEIYANDTMIFKDAPRTVKLAGGAQKRKITLEYSDNLPYLCIWKFPDSGARYVCLEPWSDVPSDGETPENFVSRPMSRISRDESADYEYTVTFE